MRGSTIVIRGGFITAILSCLIGLIEFTKHRISLLAALRGTLYAFCICTHVFALLMLQKCWILSKLLENKYLIPEVQDKKIIELGAGTGLVSIVAASQGTIGNFESF